MINTRRAVGPFVLASLLFFGVRLAAQLQIVVPPLAVKLDGGLTATPNPGGGSVIGPRTISARLIMPGGEPAPIQARVFGISGHPRTPVRDALYAVLTLSTGDVVLVNEVTPRNGSRITRAVRTGNIRANLLGGRVGDTFVFTAPASRQIAVQRFDSAFSETSPRVQETLVDGTRLTYWTTPLTWHLVPQPGVAQPIGTDFALTFTNGDLTGSLDYMQLNGDPNAALLVSCLGPTGVAPTCTFSGAGIFREYYGTAVVRSLPSLGLSPTQFLGASALDLSEQPFTACPPAPPPLTPGPVFLHDRGTRVIAAFNNIPCAEGFDITVDTTPPDRPLYQQRVVGGTAVAVDYAGDLPQPVSVGVVAYNAFGRSATGRVPLITAGSAPAGCPPSPPPPTSVSPGFYVAVSGFQFYALEWNPVDCASGYVARLLYPDGSSRDVTVAQPRPTISVSALVPPGATRYAAASRGADGILSAFSAAEIFGF